MAYRTLTVLASLLLFTGACGKAESRGAAFDDPSTSSSSSGGNTNTSGGFGAGTTSSSSSSGGTGTCAAATTYVYVVSQDNQLYRFEPDKKTFTIIGFLQCPADFGATPNSMAVDRSGMAWVNFSDGTLFKVSTTDASCTATNFEPLQHGFQRFGMAFATNGANTDEETLYVAGIEDTDTGQGLAKIDLTTLKLTPIGDFSGKLAGRGAELTGTGDGRLYGFFTTSPNATLAQIDTSTGATSDVSELDGVSTGEAWAFSFWGGDFWFYTSQGLEPSTVQRKATSSDGSISTAVASVGDFEIVGAGVSTCAPISPPK